MTNILKNVPVLYLTLFFFSFLKNTDTSLNRT